MAHEIDKPKSCSLTQEMFKLYAWYLDKFLLHTIFCWKILFKLSDICQIICTITVTHGKFAYGKFKIWAHWNQKEPEILFCTGRRSNLVDSYVCCFFAMKWLLNDHNSKLQFQTNDLDVNTNKKSCMKHCIVFFHCYMFEKGIVFSKNSLSVSKLYTRNSNFVSQTDGSFLFRIWDMFNFFVTLQGKIAEQQKFFHSCSCFLHHMVK